MGRYSVPRSNARAIYNCLHCNKECKKRPTNKGLYCSNKCQRDYQWNNVTAPRIERGEVRSDSTGSIHRFLTERSGYMCSVVECGISEWHGNKITLDVDHIDGDNKNNKGDNLRFLCPNCHRQTPTWGNKRRPLESDGKTIP